MAGKRKKSDVKAEIVLCIRHIRKTIEDYTKRPDAVTKLTKMYEWIERKLVEENTQIDLGEVEE